MRLFVGLPLPAAYQDGLAALTAQLTAELAAEVRASSRARLAWTRPGNWHLTLMFLGETAADRLPGLTAALARALAALPFRAFPLQAAGAGVFPSLARPRVLWAGLGAGADETRVLAACIRTALAPLGFAAEERPFAPHLTLARVKEAGRADIEPLLARMSAARWPQISMGEVVLWKSVPGPDGPAYTRQAVFAAVDSASGPARGAP